MDNVGFLGATLEENYSVGLTDYFPVNYQSYYFLSPVRSPLEQINLTTLAVTMIPLSGDIFDSPESLTFDPVSGQLIMGALNGNLYTVEVAPVGPVGPVGP